MGSCKCCTIILVVYSMSVGGQRIFRWCTPIFEEKCPFSILVLYNLLNTKLLFNYHQTRIGLQN